MTEKADTNDALVERLMPLLVDLGFARYEGDTDDVAVAMSKHGLASLPAAPAGLEVERLVHELREQSRFPSGQSRISEALAREIVTAALPKPAEPADVVERDRVCILLSDNPLPLDDLTNIPLGHAAEKLADKILAALSAAPAAPEAGDTRRGDGELVGDLEMARKLIQEAKGHAEGPDGGFVTNHLDAAEHWIGKVQDALTAKPVDAPADHFADAGKPIPPADVVERVAKAICEASGQMWRDGILNGPGMGMRPADSLNNHWRHKARAAIAALRTQSAVSDGGDHAGLVELLRDYCDDCGGPARLCGPCKAAQALTAQAAENAALRDRVKALEEGLGPFAALPIKPEVADSAPVLDWQDGLNADCPVFRWTAGDFRRARALLAPATGAGK